MPRTACLTVSGVPLRSLEARHPQKDGGRGWPTRSAVGLARDPPPRSTSNKSASINAHWLNSPAGRISRSAGTRQSKRGISSDSAKQNRNDPSDDNRRGIENEANTNGQHAVRELTRLRARKSHEMVENLPPRIKPRACETRGTHQTLHPNTHFGLSSSARSVFADSGRHIAWKQAGVGGNFNSLLEGNGQHQHTLRLCPALHCKTIDLREEFSGISDLPLCWQRKTMPLIISN